MRAGLAAASQALMMEEKIVRAEMVMGRQTVVVAEGSVVAEVMAVCYAVKLED